MDKKRNNPTWCCDQIEEKIKDYKISLTEIKEEEVKRQMEIMIDDLESILYGQIGRGDIVTNMTLKELIEYESELCSLQQEYEGKLTKIYGEADSSNKKRRLTIVLNLIIEERQKVNRQKYKPV